MGIEFDTDGSIRVFETDKYGNEHSVRERKSEEIDISLDELIERQSNIQSEEDRKFVKC